MYINWLFLFLPKKREEEKENEVAKPVLITFSGFNRFSPKIQLLFE
jgi:hypothetical protein